MANSKHAHVRYNILDNCFRNKAFTFKELLEYVNLKIADVYPGEGISERTLREDIKLFKDPINGFGAPLEEMSRTYKYSDANFSIALKPLLPYEKELIDASQQLLQRFENHPKYDKLTEALIKFQDEESDGKESVLYYDHNEEYKGVGWLKPLYLAIQKKQVLKITFRSNPEEDAYTYNFHPHILKQYNRRWFVFGLKDENKIPTWSIPLDDRLIDFEVNENIGYLESEINWDAHFRNLVGVRRNLEDVLQFVKLKFHSKKRLNLFLSKPLVPDFDEDLREENVVHFETIINPELVQQILSYGKDVEVLEPELLIKQMKEQSKSMKQFYE